MEDNALNIARLMELPKINDPRGNLTAIESGRDVPFKVMRNYWIYDVPSGMWRDGHAFKVQQEFIVALSGSFDVVVNDGMGNEHTYHLSRPQIGLYIPNLTWRHINNFSTNSVALVLTSTYYDANDYIEDFDEYKTLKNGKTE
ncbi:MAG: WxcM-like domain-containing protein [Muribaculaceae bacterium]|nr:WxcM-like domain-containing protein [Muribaculaceae bacterium]